jgi:hypothetical protein
MAEYKKEGPLPPPSDHSIPLDDAVELVKRYRTFCGPAAEKGGFFWAEPIRRMLAEPGCVGMRYYHGVDADGKYRIILLGVDSNGRDIVRHISGGGGRAQAGGEGQALESHAMSSAPLGDSQLENHYPCPPFCPPDGPFA